MEVDDVSGCADKVAGNTDIDSGFENMEVSIILRSLIFFSQEGDSNFHQIYYKPCFELKRFNIGTFYNRGY